MKCPVSATNPGLGTIFSGDLFRFLFLLSFPPSPVLFNNLSCEAESLMWHEEKELHSAEMECGTFKKAALSRAELWSVSSLHSREVLKNAFFFFFKKYFHISN